MYDWKRSKEIKLDNPWSKGIKEITKDKSNTNFWHYSIQLSIYKLILERKYDIIIDSMFFLCLHPNRNTYKKYKVEWQEEFMKKLISYRLKQLKIS